MISFEALIEDLKCPECEKEFEIPQILTCGKVICSECLTKILDQNIDDLDQFKCVCCNDLHKIPVNGFPVCEPLMKILKKTSKKVACNEREIKMKATFNELGTLLNEIENNFKNGANLIKEHCDQIRNNINLAHQFKTDQLNAAKQSLIDQTISYETESIRMLNSDTKNTEIFAERIEKLKSIYKNYFLQTTNLNDSNPDQAKQDLIILKSELMPEIENVKRFIFFNHELKFIQNRQVLNETSLGELKLTSLKLIDFNELNKLTVDEYFMDENGNPTPIDDISFGYFSNNDLNICYTTNSQLNFMIFNDNKDLINHKIYKKIDKFEELFVHDERMVYLYQSTKNSYLEVTHKNLTNFSHLKVNNQRLIGVNDSFIYCYDDKSTLQPIILYSWSLVVIQSIGQKENIYDLFYFPAQTNRVHFRDGKHYCLIYDDEKVIFKIKTLIINLKYNLTIKLCRLFK